LFTETLLAVVLAQWLVPHRPASTKQRAKRAILVELIAIIATGKSNATVVESLLITKYILKPELLKRILVTRVACGKQGII
jgi:hypothetical protein